MVNSSTTAQKSVKTVLGTVRPAMIQQHVRCARMGSSTKRIQKQVINVQLVWITVRVVKIIQLVTRVPMVTMLRIAFVWLMTALMGLTGIMMRELVQPVRKVA